MNTGVNSDSDSVRLRVIAAAAGLIASGGRDAATTRAVAVLADVQAPTIYRLFGDKDGLLDAVAEHELAAYVARKSIRTPHPDPVQELRHGWDMHVAFGLAHPHLFTMMSADPHQHRKSPAAEAGQEVLRRRVRSIALAGRLRVSEERAVALIHATCTGTVLTLLEQVEKQRDLGLSNAAREAMLTAIAGQAPPLQKPGIAGLAAALRASLAHTAVLSDGERLLLGELLQRIADGQAES